MISESARDTFENRLAAAWPVVNWQDVTVLLAVSGGADSVALLRAVLALRSDGAGRCIVAHCNHRLRGAASDADAAFVAELCRRLGVPCETGLVDVASADAGNGLEAAARDARYSFLKSAAHHVGARYLVTAHTADDQAETVLHRLIRGTGLAGLAGIPRVRPLTEFTTLIRPLLWARRSEVVSYLARLGQDYCDDASNAQRSFTRNRIRHDLLPQLARDYNPGVVDALIRVAQLSAEAQEVISALAKQLGEVAACSSHDRGLLIDGLKLRQQPRYLIREVLVQLWQAQGWPLQAMGLAEWNRLAELIEGACNSSRQEMPGKVQADWDATQHVLRLVRCP